MFATIGSTNAKPNTSHEVTAPRVVSPSGRTIFASFYCAVRIFITGSGNCWSAFFSSSVTCHICVSFST